MLSMTITARCHCGRVSARHTFEALTVDDLRDALTHCIRTEGYGGSDIGCKFRVMRGPVHLGDLSYNGRWWPIQEASR